MLKKNNFMKYFINLVFCVYGFYGYSQEYTKLQQYMFNYPVINPAGIGMEKYLVANISHTSQWVGMDGAPEYQVINIHKPIKYKRIALGAMLEHHKIDVRNSYNISTTYAYRLVFPYSVLSLGFRLQGILKTDNASQLKTVQLGDEQYLEDANSIMYNTGVGIFYKRKNYFVGFSIPRMFANKINLTEKNGESTFAPLKNEIFLTGGYNYQIFENTYLKPSFLFEHLYQYKTQLYMNLNFSYKKHSAGIAYKTDNSTGFLLRIGLSEHLYFSYMYSYNMSEINTYNSGTHEILLQYHLRGKFTESYQSPRHFE